MFCIGSEIFFLEFHRVWVLQCSFVFFFTYNTVRDVVTWHLQPAAFSCTWSLKLVDFIHYSLYHFLLRITPNNLIGCNKFYTFHWWLWPWLQQPPWSVLLILHWFSITITTVKLFHSPKSGARWTLKVTHITPLSSLILLFQQHKSCTISTCS